ncbi:DUF1173 domain-containing protein [Mesorhizobium sp.]|uniref:DUF1173 domain-containing protein n=1 Tax=Mesorhizobium sp. TaxID=1871066 RepID=UPI000FE5A8D6|nr:DUF1173 domain-containing protein [Mesorhizobium sp.]RWJ01287.1 MAG: DUF1173 domain-containing protein [Mesorhizobium sp.]TIP88407.1 MAG: DUF1173 domain-containing protein [Mesorhizobium sp.]
MRQFRIGDQIVEETAPDLQPVLERAYEGRQRPLCLCREPPVAMYIARLDGQYLVKRMPSSGRDHDPACPSYEPPYELSGLGPLIGSAIQIDDATGTAMLKLDFSLSKRGSRAAPASQSQTSDTVRNETSKLSLRAMLHYLWDVAELTEWTSLWAGKRGWGKVRSNLINAAKEMTARGGALDEILFVPEVFQTEDKAAIATRRANALADLHATGRGPRKLMLLVGEVKEFTAARSGQKIVIKHMPDFPLMLDDGPWRRANVRYEPELALWRSDEGFHLVAIATFGISSAGMAYVDEIALMVVNENWIPFETVQEHRLLARLAGMRRKSVKGLRFNLARDQPIVCVTLPEQRPSPVAMYIVPGGASAQYERALAEMIEARPEMTPWVWRSSDGEMPPFPD